MNIWGELNKEKRKISDGNKIIAIMLSNVREKETGYKSIRLYIKGIN